VRKKERKKKKGTWGSLLKGQAARHKQLPQPLPKGKAVGLRQGKKDKQCKRVVKRGISVKAEPLVDSSNNHDHDVVRE